jgi:ABC-type nitrate/sulfonate/bicarbonate transport system substrate-binding protein
VRLWQQSGGRLIRVIAGAGSGGAELVVRKDITRAAQLAGRPLAAPAGGAQDAALGFWLRGQGVSPQVTGSDSEFQESRPAQAADLLKGQVQASQLITAERPAGQAAAGEELQSLLGSRVPAALLTQSFAQVTATNNPLVTSVLAEARHAAAAGALKPVTSLAGFFDLRPLNQLLRSAGQPAIGS